MTVRLSSSNVGVWFQDFMDPCFVCSVSAIYDNLEAFMNASLLSSSSIVLLILVILLSDY